MPSDGGPIEVVFNAILNAKTIVAVFYNDSGSVSIGEISIYNDINVDNEQPLPQESYNVENYIRLQDGFFFDPIINNYWIPHGIAYLTWDDTRGQWQTPAELKHDLDLMSQMGVNAIRVDFIWKNIEITSATYNWSLYDMLLEEAQARNIRVFPILAYSETPDWITQ